MKGKKDSDKKSIETHTLSFVVTQLKLKNVIVRHIGRKKIYLRNTLYYWHHSFEYFELHVEGRDISQKEFMELVLFAVSSDVMKYLWNCSNNREREKKNKVVFTRASQVSESEQRSPLLSSLVKSETVLKRVVNYLSDPKAIIPTWGVASKKHCFLVEDETSKTVEKKICIVLTSTLHFKFSFWSVGNIYLHECCCGRSSSKLNLNNNSRRHDEWKKSVSGRITRGREKGQKNLENSERQVWSFNEKTVLPRREVQLSVLRKVCMCGG